MIEYRVLGPFEVRDGDRPIPLRAPKLRSLLAVLLLRANEVVSADALIDALWEAPPADARHSLQVLVSQLRALLEPDRSRPSVLLSRASGYLLNVHPEQLDLRRFERLWRDGSRALAAGDAAEASRTLTEALALWRGEPLADLAYEELARPAIARLAEMRLAATCERIDADLALGHHLELVSELEELAARHPLAERLRAQLMLALYRCGRAADALRVYEDVRRLLDEELGLPPSPLLRRLHQAILRHDARLELAHRPAAHEARAGTAPDRCVLVAALDEAGLAALLELALPLTRARLERELIVATLVPTAAGLPHAAARVERLVRPLAASGAAVRSAAFVSPSPGCDLARFAAGHEIDLLLLDCPPEVVRSGHLAGTAGAVLADAICDVGLLAARGARLPPGPVLVPFGGSEHDWSALELAAWIASTRESALALLGRVRTEADEGAVSRLLASASIVAQRYLGVAAEPRLAGPTLEDALDAAAGASLVVAGVPPGWRREGLGATRHALLRQARPPVLLIRKGTRPGGLAPPGSYTAYTWSLPALGR